ncbi:MAG: NHLP bacteriocin export ABC transporter permease/ATPase subunit [Vicinamibacterales bacterium]
MPGSSGRTDGAATVWLTDPGVVWIVEAGRADVFLVRVGAGDAPGARHHLFRAPAGAWLFGAAAGPGGHQLLAVPTPGSQLRRADRDGLIGAAGPAAVAAGADAWIAAFSAALTTDTPPRVFTLLEPDADFATSGETRRLMPRAGVVWAQVHDGAAYLFGDRHLPLGAAALPVAAAAWIEADAHCRGRADTTAARVAAATIWDDLDRVMILAADAAVRGVDRARQRETARIERRTASEQRDLDRAFRRLAAASLPGTTAEDGGGDPWLGACRAVAGAMGLALDAPQEPGLPNSREPLRTAATTLGLRWRVVALKGRWWTEDAGPLVARREADGAPVAVIPSGAGRYHLVDPVSGARTPVSETVAESLEPLAWCLYRPFPSRPLRWTDLARFGLQGAQRDLATVLLMGIGTGLLALVFPVVTGVVFDSVIPAADRRQLLVVSLLLAAAAACGAAFQLVQNFAMQRVESRMSASVEAAVWDRLLRLPVPFFRDYSAGDLANRSLGISEMRRIVTGAVVSSALSGVFSAFSFGLLFYYSWPLALLATVLTVVTVLATAGLGALDVRYQRDAVAASGRLSGLLLQFVNGIAKLRVSATENRAFAIWAGQFSARQRLTRKARLVGVALSVFSAVMPVLAMALIFWMSARPGAAGGPALSTGTFLAFNAAFSQFQMAALSLSGAVVTLLGLVPLYERAHPILEAVPESDRSKADPGDLAGHIEVAHVNFRYRPEAPLVLRDVSMRIPAGRFVAIVGASGSGKSTLFRMLMGFERPESGAIYFDQQDQTHLDVEALRRQIGVVLQSGRLLTDSLFRNIAGASPLTIDEAWAAAAMAGLEADIRAMPMGMHTLVAEGGGGLSGGQRQRVMIARAIARRPRILLFDEATSALDNETQAIVTRSLASLRATRVVIAHRLSTIMHADYIYVMDKGRVVQEGTYEALLHADGPFAELSRRQTA